MGVCKLSWCEKPVSAMGLCTKHANRWYRTGSVVRMSVLGRFLEYSVRRGDCWLWTKKLVRRKPAVAYPRAQVNKKTVAVHRWMYEYFYGVKLESSEQLRRVCGNVRCINPTHMVRQLNFGRVGHMVEGGTSARGEKNSHAVLTEDQALEVIVKLLAASVSQRSIAGDYGVSAACINHIKKRRTWRHLTEGVFDG